jgi:hypothetical protein
MPQLGKLYLEKLEDNRKHNMNIYVRYMLLWLDVTFNSDFGH